MTTTDKEADMKAAAREWLLRLSLESPTSADQARFEAWRAEDPRHAEAYQRFESIWHDAATLTELERFAPLPAAPDRWPRGLLSAMRAHPAKWAAGVGVAGAISVLSVWLSMSPTHFATGVAEVREIRLTDGSEVILGARSSIDTSFRDNERRVTMHEGEAFFSVSKNPARPFVVIVGDKEVRVVGTKFEIRRRDMGVRVSVVEGRVEVMQLPVSSPATSVGSARSARIHAEAAYRENATVDNGVSGSLSDVKVREQQGERVLIAGQQVTAAMAEPIPAPELMPRGEPAAWRRGRLVYVDAPLSEVVADANRYSRESIAIGDQRIADLRVSVTYPSNRIEEMLSALSSSLSLDIERPGAGQIVLKSKGGVK
jgi:transmembrane sensor